jgi:hypothetical protein
MRWGNRHNLAALVLTVVCGCTHTHLPTPRPGVYAVEPTSPQTAPPANEHGTVFVDPYHDQPAAY